MSLEQLEEVAAWIHETWSRWSQGWLGVMSYKEKGELVASMQTAYADLPEKEKEWRRKEALGLLGKVDQLCEMARRMGAEAAERGCQVAFAERRARVRALLNDPNVSEALCQRIMECLES